jgi:hypothetical protein
MLREDRMTMKRITLTLAALLAITTAYAQIYQWKDESGKTIISDKPPVGQTTKSRKLAPESSGAEGGAASGSKSPQSLADRDLDYRKRQKEAQEKAEKADKAQKANTDRNENCESARRYLQTLESGERVALRDEKGERYYMDDAERARESSKARQTLQSDCK